MALVLNQGSRLHDNETSNRFVIQMDDEITPLVADNAPFTILASQIPNRETRNRKFEWMEDEDWANTVVTNAASAADADLSFGSGEFEKIRNGDILYNPKTDERFLITVTPSAAGTVTTTNNWPTGSGGSAVAAGDTLFIIGNAVVEASSSRDLITNQVNPKFNYVQQFRDPFQVSGRINATELYGPDALPYLDNKVFRNHMRQIEATLLFGARGLDTANGRTTSAGLKWFFDQSGSGTLQKDMTTTALTLTELLDFFEQAFLFGSRDKLFLMGRNVTQIINGFAYEKLRVDMELSRFGLHIMQFDNPFGTARLLNHRLFTDFNMDDEAWLIDLGALEIRGLPGRLGTQLNTGPNGGGIQNPDVDAIKFEYVSEIGMQLRHSENFARIFNVPAA